MKNFRRYSLWLVALSAVSASAAVASQASLPPNPTADALIEQLRTGNNVARVEALKKMCEAGAVLAPYVHKAWESISPSRPAVPRSFAKALRANLDGERDLYAATMLLSGGSGSFVMPGVFVDNQAKTVFGRFNEVQQKRPFAVVAAGNSELEITQQLDAFPFIPLLNKPLHEAVVKLLDHKSLNVRHTALRCLSYFSCEKIPAINLLPLVNSNDPLIAGPAAIILARQGDDPKLVEVLAAAKNNPSQWESLADLLCYCDHAQAGRFLKSLLDDSDWHVRLFSAGCLLALKENAADAEKVLLDLFALRGHEMKCEAAWILYELGSDDARKDVIRGLYNQRKALSQVYLGVSDWLGRKPELKKKAEAAAEAAIKVRGNSSPFGQFMVEGYAAMDLRDAVRLGLGEKVKARLKTTLQNLIDMPPPPLAGKTSTKITSKEQDRYVYSIMSTVLSELDPAEYHKQIERCVQVIRYRQLGSGMWSYRDPADNERDDYKDGYAQASPNDFELPQAFYAVCGLESAKVHGDVPVDTEIFMKALRGTLYTQNLDGGFSNYPQPSPRVPPGMVRPDLAAWGLGIVAICLRNGMLDIEQDPDLLARAFIGREAARLLLARCAAAKSDTSNTMRGKNMGGAAAWGASFQLRELAFTYGNDGLINPDDCAALEKANGQNFLYMHGFPEPPDSTSPPWIDEPVIEAKDKTAKLTK